MKEIQPHLQEQLWPIYLAEQELREVAPPTDGRQEAPGGKPDVPTNSE